MAEENEEWRVSIEEAIRGLERKLAVLEVAPPEHRHEDLDRQIELQNSTLGRLREDVWKVEAELEEATEEPVADAPKTLLETETQNEEEEEPTKPTRPRHSIL